MAALPKNMWNLQMNTDRFLTFTINFHPLLAFRSVALLSLLPYFLCKYFTFHFSVPLQDIREALGEARTCHHFFPVWLFPLVQMENFIAILNDTGNSAARSTESLHTRNRTRNLALLCIIVVIQNKTFLAICIFLFMKYTWSNWLMHLELLHTPSVSICTCLHTVLKSILVTSTLDRSGIFC